MLIKKGAEADIYLTKWDNSKAILKLVKQNRKAKFVSIISFYDKKNNESFESKVNGFISKKSMGSGWGYDPIFYSLKFKKNICTIKQKPNISSIQSSKKIF